MSENNQINKQQEELLPCPFCGGKAQLDEIERGSDFIRPMGYFIYCLECGVEHGGGYYNGFSSGEDAIKVWNKRAFN